jgi:hypothetical protein
MCSNSLHFNGLGVVIKGIGVKVIDVWEQVYRVKMPGDLLLPSGIIMVLVGAAWLVDHPVHYGFL